MQVRKKGAQLARLFLCKVAQLARLFLGKIAQLARNFLGRIAPVSQDRYNFYKGFLLRCL